MPDPNDKIISDYEKKHLANIARTNERIREVFSDAIHTLTLSAGRIRFNGEVFDLSKYPALKAQIEEVLAEMGGNIYTAIVNSIEASWGLSNEKNDILVDRRLAGKKPSPNASQILYDPNKQALEAFIKRKDKGMNLSKKVWKLTGQFKQDLELNLSMGISEGKSAREMAKDVQKYLVEPDNLFRRVRAIKGDPKSKLKFSKAYLNKKVEPGVYKSSYKNALRLTRNENNLAFRRADMDRWSRLPFVIGYEVRLSNRHKIFDVCDHLSNKKYPKDLTFSGWHVSCLCHAIPLMASDEDYEKLEDAILAGEEPPTIPNIDKPPAEFNQWVKDNRDRINSWRSKPYWITENEKYVNALLKPKKK